jgi:UDP-2,3-diacylglucosamine pyrophosphatase LpxH
LGYANCDKAGFDAFLDSLAARNDVTHLVLLGDVVDMWRRDASGVFLENHDTIRRILTLKSKGIQTYYVAGNHDYHVLHLHMPTYPFEFRKDLTLTDGKITYRFVHGHEYDPDQKAPLMEFLCRVMSDGEGTLENALWNDFNRVTNAISKVEPTFLKEEIGILTERIQRRPEERLKGDSLNKINARACRAAEPGEILIFGHTHVPFINKAENVVNTGSWVKDANPHGTYVELFEGKPRLFIYGNPPREIKERTDY